jgi:4a-hydroxytetrahydrobiopterin dehydratase
MSKLTERRCAACAPGTPPLSEEQRGVLGAEVPAWAVVDGARIKREYKFKTYMDGIHWVQLIGQAADADDHHPDIHVFYRKVLVELWTHTVNGLSENDYILAAKFDQIYDSFDGKR